MVKKFIIFIALLFATTNINAVEKQWYQHGELYKHTMMEWKKSNLLEKLSFSANYISTYCPNIIKSTKQAGDFQLEMLKLYSTNLSICIDESYVEDLKTWKILDNAAVCKNMMNYN
jgi:hypothetical protein